jgi:ketosteroid isomerase-like protein
MVIRMADAKQVVEREWQAYIQHDLDSLLEVYAEDAVLTVPDAPPAEGREAIGEMWKGFLDAFPDDSPTVERILVDGDTVIVEFRSDQTNSGPLLLPSGETLPATGRRIAFQGVSISDVEDGQITRETFYWDSVLFATQLGLMPEEREGS